MLRLLRQYYPLRNVLFVIGEGFIICSSVLIASWILFGSGSFYFSRLLIIKTLVVTLIFQACLYYNDLYDFKNIVNLSELGVRLLQALGVGTILLAIIYVVVPSTEINNAPFIVAIAMVLLLSILWRFGYTLILSRDLFNQKIILLGSGDLINEIKKEINSRKDCGYSVVCEFSESKYNNHPNTLKEPSYLRYPNWEGLADTAKSMGVTKIVAAFKEQRQGLPTADLLKCRIEGIDVVDGNSFYEMLTGKLMAKRVPPSWLIFSGGFQKTSFRFFLKRVFDVMLSLFLLILLLPVILITALLIKLDSKGSVIFSQERLGEDRKKYQMYKLRSMVVDAEKDSGPVWAQENDKRVTRIGRIIRKWRIDEIPQLWNVIRGDMSFVGPRPEREFFVSELEEAIPYYGIRFAIKPGITGWAQVRCAYGSSVEDAIEKLNYELFYIKNMSPLMDFMIVLKTIKIVIFGKGAR